MTDAATIARAHRERLLDLLALVVRERAVMGTHEGGLLVGLGEFAEPMGESLTQYGC